MNYSQTNVAFELCLNFCSCCPNCKMSAKNIIINVVSFFSQVNCYEQREQLQMTVRESLNNKYIMPTYSSFPQTQKIANFYYNAVISDIL